MVFRKKYMIHGPVTVNMAETTVRGYAGDSSLASDELQHLAEFDITV